VDKYVGIDLHRRRSVIVRMTGEGQVLETVQREGRVGRVGKTASGSS